MPRQLYTVLRKHRHQRYQRCYGNHGCKTSRAMCLFCSHQALRRKAEQITMSPRCSHICYEAVKFCWEELAKDRPDQFNHVFPHGIIGKLQSQVCQVYAVARSLPCLSLLWSSFSPVLETIHFQDKLQTSQMPDLHSCLQLRSSSHSLSGTLAMH